MSFSNSTELKNHKTTTPNKSNAHPRLYKQKKIKKRRKIRSEVQPAYQTEPHTLIQDFLATRSSEYFSLSAKQAKEVCNRTFRSFVHIKNIIGQQQNVYNLKNYSQAPALANKYLIMGKLANNSRPHRLKITSKQSKKIVKCYLHKQDVANKKDIILVDEAEALLLQKRQEMLQEVDKFFGDVLKDRPEGGVDPIAREIIALCKLNNIFQNQLKSDIQRAVKVESDNLYEAQQVDTGRSNSLENRYCQLIIKKNLKAAFSQNNLDYLNYFRIRDIQQQDFEDNEPLKLLENAQQFRNYLKIMKPNQNKDQKDQLKTACGACFSDCNEAYNPLVRCPQCGIRLHRLCHNLRGKCQKCKYTRKTTQQKSNKPYCFICLRDKQQGISIEALKNEREQHYAHTFCLLISKFWSIRNSETIYQMNLSGIGEQICSICSKKGGVCVKDEVQHHYYHGLCAFVQGYSLSLSDDGDVSIKGANLEGRVQLQRRYKLNFQKTLYRRTEEIIAIIQSQ